IAREVEIGDDEVANTGAMLARQAAEKTNDEAGDGTTTTIVLLQAFLNEMMKVKTKDVRGLREEIEKNLEKVYAYLDEHKMELGEGDIFRIAKNSSLDQDIAKVVEELMVKIGKDGLVSIEDGQKPGITSEVVLGIKVDDGYMSPYMITDPETMKSTIKDAPILLSSKKRIMSIKDILPVLEGLQSKGKNELVLMVEDISDDVLANLVVNKIKGVFNVCVIRTRNMDDVAVVTGAEIVTEEAGMKFSEEVLGYADKVETGKHHCLVTGGKEDQETVNAKIEELKKVRENADNEYDKQVAATRIARLQGGVSLIKIAGDNEQQTKEKKLKLEDALNAVKSAMDEGIIEGGGMALYKYAESVEKKVKLTEAETLLVNIIKSPFIQILSNADEKLENILTMENSTDKVFGEKGCGYNVITRQWENFYESGIIDPVKVVKKALKNAFAMGTSIMTAEAGVILTKEKK
ncbi:MAG: TCP-1/cpn60 chaperonin family protein, partial [Methanolobus sp.]|nr:TCP-1/cpn60 chaperonin family protein [Methanolobus sp.]